MKLWEKKTPAVAEPELIFFPLIQHIVASFWLWRGEYWNFFPRIKLHHPIQEGKGADCPGYNTPICLLHGKEVVAVPRRAGIWPLRENQLFS